jgi:peptidoglycan/LPS O-acetylase OafA/YrhL
MADSKRLLGLDGIRAIAVTLVIASHMRYALAMPIYIRSAMNYGIFGVSIFFVLSGFLITWLLLEEEKKRQRFDLQSFYVRRFFRIQPPALVYLTFISMLGTFGAIHIRPRDVIACLLIYRNFTIGDRATAHFWSLSIEEQFYLIWPFALFVLKKPRARLAVAIALIAFAPFLRHYWNLKGGVIWSRTDLNYDALVVGCALALVRSRASGMKVLQTPIFQSPGTAFVCMILGCVAIAGFTHYGPLRHLHLFILEPTISYLLVAALINQAVEGRGRFLNAGTMTWLGRVSYSLYLWQQLAFDPSLAWSSIAAKLPLAVAIAAASYYLIEQPFNRLRLRFTVQGSST